MEHKKSYDHIDLELSKAFFGAGAKQPGTEEPKPGPHPTISVSSGIAVNKRSRYRRPAVIVTAAVAALLITFISWISALPTKYTASAEALTIPVNAKVLSDFEQGTESWEIPSWALERPEYAAGDIRAVKKVSTNGNMSLQISVDFPERSWSAAIVELSQFLDLTDYDTISVDIFLPFKAPKGLRAKMILTVGDNWRFTEMSRSVRLEPGKWNRIEARVAGKTFDWRGVRSGDNFRNDIRKIAVRIESDKRPAYKGHIYIDTLMVYGTNGK